MRLPRTTRHLMLVTAVIALVLGLVINFRWLVPCVIIMAIVTFPQSLVVGLCAFWQRATLLAARKSNGWVKSSRIAVAAFVRRCRLTPPPALQGPGHGQPHQATQKCDEQLRCEEDRGTQADLERTG